MAPSDPAVRLSVLQAIEEARHQDFEIRRSTFYAFGIAHDLKLTVNSCYGPLRTGRPVCNPIDTPLAKALAEQRDWIANPD